METEVDFVGCRVLVGVDAEGNERRFVVGVGRPVQQPKGEWICPVVTHDDPLARSIRGEDSFQALCLGISLIVTRLEDFVDAGGRLFLPDGHDEISRDDLGRWFSRLHAAPR
jgi:hypothetical protein